MASLALPLFVLSMTFLVAGCETVPQAQIDEANSLGDGNYRVETTLSTDQSFSLSRGIGENTDFGIQIDWPDNYLYSAYLKYSHLNVARGWSLASLIGGFTDRRKTQKGYFIGPVTSYRADRFLFSLRARYNKLENRDGQDNDTDTQRFLSDEVAQADVSIRGFLVDDQVSLKLGYGCVYQLGNIGGENQNFGIDRECSFVIGASFYTQ